ncbi:adenylate cyclase [Rhizobium binxianense]|uniref:adenylate cyclase n=1 Tax=Rhizobium binxianense TaxID=3024242 RepID=UPI0023A99ADD|nr:adenylate cyclase [Rhizobium sp. MJ22]WEA24506.1 adenylate cyclase [Rhizobium sp. MJ22]
MTASTRDDLPCVEEVRAQLQRILADPEFPAVGRVASFLRYVVEETLEGRGGRIKGYAIAVEVFGRRDTFSQDDPVVRIEAGRLRRSLEHYYLLGGKNDPVRIDVPKGGYVPSFSWNDPPPQKPDNQPLQAEVPRSPDPWWRGRRAAFAGGGTVAALAALLVVLGLASPSPPAIVADAVPDRPTLVVAPFANLGNDSNAQLYAIGLTEELLTALPRFKEVKVFGRETSKTLPSDVDASRVREKLGARYLLAGGVRASGTRLRVTVRLLDTSDDAIVWSQDYENDIASDDLFAIQTDVARRVATTIAQPYGVIAQVDVANPPPDDRGTYACTLHFYAYRSELSVDGHLKVRECLETAVARYPTYATAWAMLSIVYLDEDRFKFNVQNGTDPPMQRALRAARRSTQLDAGNTRGLQALMMALFFNREFDDAMRIGEQALATNPNDTELMGEFGTRLSMGGDWARGAALLDRAIALNPGGGGYFHGTRALAAYMLHDNATAVREIDQADLQKFPLFHAVAAVIYAEAGKTEMARREGEAFVKMRTDFLPNVASELAIRNLQPADAARLINGFRKAGMPVPQDVVASATLGGAASDLQPR